MQRPLTFAQADEHAATSHTFAQAKSHSSMLRSQLTCAEAASHAASASAWARRVRIEALPSGRRLKVKSAYRAWG